MARTRKEINRLASLAHSFLYAVDARAPRSTFYRNLVPSRARIQVILTKGDLADPQKSERWKRWFASQGYPVFRSPDDLEKEARTLPRVLVVGLPNVGKSTVINRLVGRKKTRTAALPGTTRGPQWVKLSGKFYLLDTPGVFFPQHLPEESAWRLAALGTVPEQSYRSRLLEIGQALFEYVRNAYGLFRGEGSFEEFLESLARRRGALQKGGGSNLEEAARKLLLDFQRGTWGRITLEEP